MKTNIKIGLTFILLLSMALDIKAQTEIPKGQVRGIWNNGGSPYQIKGDIVIPQGDSLVINAGVKVEFQGYYSLKVEGKIVAKGTKKDRIIFTGSDTAAFDKKIKSGWHGIRFVNQKSTNDTSVLSFCTIKYGEANGNEVNTDEVDFCGGGIYISDSSKVSISHSIIQHNKSHVGGGLYCKGAWLKMDSCTIRHNSTHSDGAGIYLENSKVTLFHNTISHNTSSYRGGGMYSRYSSLNLDGNALSKNTSKNCGGAMHCEATQGLFENNIFSKNKADFGGAIAFENNSTPQLINNTIVDNVATQFGGAFYCDKSSPVVLNSILWGNNAPSGSQVFLFTNSSPQFTYCDVESGVEGFVEKKGNTITYNYNLSVEPSFESSDSLSAYYLGENSLCVNAGILDTIGLKLSKKDFNQRNRIENDRIDIGACECLKTEKKVEKKFILNSMGNLFTTSNNSESKEDAQTTSQLSVTNKPQYHLYPNPATAIVNVEISNTTSNYFTLTLFSETGQAVLQKKYQANATFKITENLELFANGAYLLELKDDQQKVVFQQKIMKK